MPLINMTGSADQVLFYQQHGAPKKAALYGV
jgi:hypothetical protein